ncbi:MAG: ABC transporter ATP-binding protein [Propionibacteriaceae bacterium]
MTVDTKALLEVNDLAIRYEPKRHRAVNAVTDVSFSIGNGEFVGLIGESGSGKTTLGTAILRMLERPGRITGGSITFDGMDVTNMSQDDLREYRWTDIATVFQSSMNSLNPVVRIEGQFRDVIEYHTRMRGEAVTRRVQELFDMVLIDHKFIGAYPHELSGGMKQRVNLALALAIEPRFVLLDEPTTGLDVVVQHNILENVRRLQTELGCAVLFISHDIGTVLDLSDRILVMYAGTIVEEQKADLLLRDPMHPYSKGLLGSYGDPRAETVRITYVPGRPPDLSAKPAGCAFAPRCPEKIDRCLSIDPPLIQLGEGRVACHVAELQRTRQEPGVEVGPRIREFAGPQFVKSASESQVALNREVLLSVEDVSKTFIRRRGLAVSRTNAVRNATFELHKGGVTALVGQSGSGKSTLARMITGVDKPTSGKIIFHGGDGDREVAGYRGGSLRSYRSHVQMVFQDPYSSLNPTKTLGYILSRPLANYHKDLSRADLRKRVYELLETVALTPPQRYASRFAYELSGGQRQRVVIARALAVEPQLIVADEPISSLDVSIRAEVLELLNKLVRESDVSILYITHDLLSARMLSDDVIVLNNGEVVEQGPALEVIRSPKDDYTKLLLQAIPNPFEERQPLNG